LVFPEIFWGKWFLYGRSFLMARFLVETFGGKSLLVILASILLLAAGLLGTAPAQTSKDDRTKAVREVAQYFIQTGIKQYERGYYIQAEKSFFRALDYEKYLTAATLKNLNELMEGTQCCGRKRTHLGAYSKGRRTN